MTLHMVTCPLCCQPGFNTSDALCSALISAATRKLFCPVCNEVLIGLDKLTIHLFGHKTSVNPNSRQNVSQGKILVSESKELESAVLEPVLYFQSENGQLFALSTNSFTNQFGAITINTQNCVTNTSASENEFVDLPQSVGKNSLHASEYSSCKDLLTSGDFSEPLGDNGSEPDCSMKTDGSFHNPESQSSCPSVTQDSSSIDNAPEAQSKIVPDHEHPDDVVPVEAEPPRHLIPCDACEMGFSNNAILAVHKQLVHKNGEVLEDAENGIQKNPEKSRKKPLSCSWCPATFNLKSSLMIHVKVTHPAQKESFERKESEKVTCPVCGKMFPKESTLNQHMKAVHGEKPWQCTVCSKSFTTKYFLRKHKRIHTGETPYECAICHKVFTFQQSYHKHMLYHTDNKPYCCSHCGRLFKELSTLNNHERIHSGEKPFACETCGKCFRQRVSYLVHRRIHTGAMPYKCTACNKSFRYKISQRTHKCPEHPPGVVVKTHTTLVDRLQAVINLGESDREDHRASLMDSTNLSTSSQTGDLANPCSSTFNHAFPADHREVHLGQDYVNSETVCRDSADPSSSDSPHRRHSTIFSGETGDHRTSASVTNVVQSFPGLFDCSGVPSEDKQPSKPFADDADVFSMNLDSSPSECLGKLSISGDYFETQGATHNPTCSRTIPHPSLSFDNMDEVDLCNLFFDVS